MLQLISPSLEDDLGPVCANLAISIAQLGHRVLLVDANLQRPSQHELLGITPEFGITSLMAGGVSVEQAIYSTPIDRLSLLPAGTPFADNRECFTRPEFSQLLRSLRDRYAYIIVDSAPLLVSSDACVIAGEMDGVILGIRPTRDSRSRAERAAEILAATGIRPIGAILNGSVGTPTWSYERSTEHLGSPILAREA